MMKTRALERSGSGAEIGAERSKNRRSGSGAVSGTARNLRSGSGSGSGAGAERERRGERAGAERGAAYNIRSLSLTAATPLF